MVCGIVLFLVCSFVGSFVAHQVQRPRRERLAVAEEWAARLMHGAEPTQYGWVPDDASSAEVDRVLERSGSAFVLLDSADRVVRASSRLAANLESFVLEDGEQDVPSLGRVADVRVPVKVFGQRQGLFVLLHPPGARVPVPESWSNAYERVDGGSGMPSGTFLLVGSVLVGLGMFTAGHLLAARRLRRMARIAMGGRFGGARRFSEAGTDEVAMLSQALDTMLRRTRRMLEVMGERENDRRNWLAELSHDLRTPLSALQLRLDNARRAGPNELREAVSAAARDCERIRALAAGFMDLAELEVTEDFHFEPVMPEELVGQTVRGLKPIADDAGVTLRAGVSSQPTIWVDGHRILRALENMVRNAIRHARKHVVITVEQNDSEMRFLVRDDGEGFEDLERDKVTEYQEWYGRRRSGGLGLRVADRVARAHGGRLVICNKEKSTIVVCTIDMMSGPPDHWGPGPTDASVEDEHAQTR